MNAAVIMAGGVGARLFPASTEERPKQFVQWPSAAPDFKGDAASTEPPVSLLQQSVNRLSTLVEPSLIYVATTADLVPQVQEQLGDFPRGNIITEPQRKNSAAACALATARIERDLGPDAVIMMLPSDAAVWDDSIYRETLRTAADVAAREPAIVVLGIQPTRASCGYGYIRTGESIFPGCCRVTQFVEKPDVQRAERLVAEGCLWNAGVYLWRASVGRQAFEALLPHHAELFRAGSCEKQIGCIFGELPPVSIDIGIAERWNRMFCVEGRFAWDDLGTWDAFSRVFPGDGSGNVRLGEARFVDSQRCVSIADEGEIVLLGVSDLVVVRFGDRVLVCPRDRSGDVGRLQ